MFSYVKAIAQKKPNIQVDTNTPEEVIISNKEVVIKIPVTVKDLDPASEGYVLKLKTNWDTNTLPPKRFSFAPDSLPINSETTIYAFYLSIKPDEKNTDDEVLAFDIILTSEKGEESDTSYDLKIVPNSSIKDYSYLAFLGTNFDLVEGIKPKNLYFGINMFLKPTEEHHLSFGLNFYL